MKRDVPKNSSSRLPPTRAAAVRDDVARRGIDRLAPGGAKATGSPREAAGPVRESGPKQDVVLALGVTDDGRGVNVLRARDERVEVGQVRPLEEGKPIQGEVVKLKPRPGAPFLCDVDTQFKTPQPSAAPKAFEATTRKGPPQVSSEAYRQNWDAIWNAGGKKPSVLN